MQETVPKIFKLLNYRNGREEKEDERKDIGKHILPDRNLLMVKGKACIFVMNNLAVYIKQSRFDNRVFLEPLGCECGGSVIALFAYLLEPTVNIPRDS